MTPHKLFPCLIVSSLIALLAALASCGGGGDESRPHSGQLTDPRSVPTASPWGGNAPAVTILDPNQLKPIGEEPTPSPGTGGTPGMCGPKYTITSGDTFSSIAEKCGLTTQGIVDANPGIDPKNLHPGDVINLPQSAPPPSPTP